MKVAVVCGIVLVCGFVQGLAAGFTKCVRDYEKIGCFYQRNNAMDLLVNDRDGKGHELDWGNFGKSLHSLACRCSEKAKAGGYTFFSIAYWAECWGGKDRSELDKVIKGPQHQSNDCKNHAFDTCDIHHEGECAGKAHSEYIYAIKEKAPVAIDGGYTEWSNFTPCTESCGGGEKIRERACTNPEPVGAGKGCNVLGNSTEIVKCNTQECPVDGVTGQWGTFGPCSKSCGVGVQTKTRSCIPPMHGGKPCASPLKETKSCTNGECPVDGKFNSWTSWGSCSLTCGVGIKERSRTCTLPLHGGKPCNGPLTETTSCTEIMNCPVDGILSAWGAYSKCSKNCGPGTKTRTRTCTPPKFGGKQCSGALKQTVDCKVKECPVDGYLSSWTKFGACSKTCGDGEKTRSRGCNPPKHGGKPCSGSLTDTAPCKVKNCPVDGKLSQWTSYGACSELCGHGTQTRTRTCTPPKWGGAACTGSFSQTRACKVKECPVDGKLSSWSAYGSCSKSCGKGVQKRTRTCTPPKFGGNACGTPLVEDRDCQVKPCPIDGRWSKWSSFTACSAKCGPGKESRTRVCTPPKFGGKPCNGAASASRNCQVKPCPVDGTVSPWSVWTRCNRECGPGTQTRSRACFPPKHGGKACPLPLTERRNCQIKFCPINGVLSAWSAFTGCSKTCGDGTQTRSRTCTPPQHGGKACSGALSESKTCKTRECPVNGGWGAWGGYGGCSRTCGNGVQVRSRPCNNPVPQHGGAACPGQSQQSKACKTRDCQTISTQCVQSNWYKSFDRSGWSTCSDWKQYMTGMYRSNRPRVNNWPWGQKDGDDGIYLIEHARCCKVSGGYENNPTDCRDERSWLHGFDHNNRWVQCQNGYFMRGMERSGGSRLHNIEAAKCCKPHGAPYQWGHCYHHNVASSFDRQGWSQCNAGYIMVGLYRGGCDDLRCIEHFKCCKMKSQ